MIVGVADACRRRVADAATAASRRSSHVGNSGILAPTLTRASVLKPDLNLPITTNTRAVLSKLASKHMNFVTSLYFTCTAFLL